VLNVNVMALQARLMVTLQHILDVLAISRLGVDRASESDYASTSFFAVFPAQQARLPYAVVQQEASRWHLRTTFRDALEATGIYLDGCRTVTALFKLAAGGALTVGTYQKVVTQEAKKFHRLGIPEKIKTLREDFKLPMDLSEHLLSINKVRNCLVHRLGLVTDHDIDDQGKLTLTYRSLQLYAPDPNGGEVIVDKTGMALPVGAPLMMRCIDPTVREFKKGERVELTHSEITQIFLTVMQFSIVMTGELQARTPQSNAPLG